MEKRSIFIAEKYNLIRAGMKSLLINEYNIVGESSDGFETLQKLKKLRPEILLTNYFLPGLNALEILEEVKKDNPEIKVIILSAEIKEELIINSFKAGALAYISKSISENEFFACLEHVINKKHYICPEVSEKVIGHLINDRPAKESKLSLLTLREREILKLIAEGRKSREIAKELFLSVKTVQTHRTNLMKKLEVHNISELISFAINNSVIEKTGITT